MLPLLVALLLGAAIPPAPATPVPFGPGERFDYVAKLDILKLGSARMEVTSIDSVRGHEAYLLRMQIDIGALFYKAHDSLASWLDTETLSTRRFWKRQQNSDARRTETFEIFPEERRFVRDDKPGDSREAPADPLDDVSFIYAVRAMPLEVGQTYSLPRYFRLDQNPLVVKVLKRENMKLPDGSKVPCLVLHPIMAGDGMFSKKSNARIWLTDDARRIPVQIKTHFGVGTGTFKLTAMRLAGDSAGGRTP